MPKPTTRRELVAAAAGAVAGTFRPAAAANAGSRARMAMVIDLDRCTGCRACAVACKSEHGVRLGGFRSWVVEEETGTYPAATRRFLPRLCNHCGNPPCLKVCPTGATRKQADGTVTVDPERCIGCRHCMAACPFGARYFNSQHDPAEEETRFPARTHGTVDKCDFCTRRRKAGEAPACVATCPAQARVFGDADDPASPVSRLLASGRAAPLLAELGTEPSVFYLGGRSER